MTQIWPITVSLPLDDNDEPRRWEHDPRKDQSESSPEIYIFRYQERESGVVLLLQSLMVLWPHEEGLVQ